MGDTTLALIVGRKRCGKSTLLRKIVLEHISQHRDMRFHVWDSTREWSRPRSVRPDQLTIYPSTEFSVEDVAHAAVLDAPAVLVVDEIDRVAPNHGGGLVAGTWLHAIVHYGRHLQTGLLAATRRQGRVHADLPALADVLFLFHLSHPRDLLAVADTCGPEWADEVQRLKPREWLRYEP